MALRDSWKETGKDLGHAFTGLGKTLVKTAQYTVGKAEDWADDGKQEGKPAAAPDGTAPAEFVFCPECGAKCGREMNFCANCGHRLILE